MPPFKEPGRGEWAPRVVRSVPPAEVVGWGSLQLGRPPEDSDVCQTAWVVLKEADCKAGS